MCKVVCGQSTRGVDSMKGMLRYAGVFVFRTAGCGWGAVLACISLTSTSTGQPCQPILVSSIDIPGDALGVDISKGVAYIASGLGGIRAIDVSDPYSPTSLGGKFTYSFAFDITVCQSVAYLVMAETHDGGAVVCVHDVSNPRDIHSINSFARYYPQDLTLQGRVAYVASFEDGLQIFDIQDPSTPELLGVYAPSNSYVAVAASGHVVYAGQCDVNPFVVSIDVSSPATPYLLDSQPIFNFFISEIAVVKDLLYVASEGNLDQLDILDASNPADLLPLGTLGLPSSCSGITVTGDRAYLANRESGLIVLDISQPTAPMIIGSYDTPDNAAHVAVSEGIAYVADRETGLLILDISSCGAIPLGDFDSDHAVNLEDAAQFIGFLKGPRILCWDECCEADLDGDCDVDMLDTRIFMNNFTGS